MNFTLRKPCDDCPFLREGGIRLTPERAEEIAGPMLDRQGATFTCHKTTVESDDDDGERVDGPNAQHCAGALIFAEKNETATQMMRIMERLGMYDASKLDMKAGVFDDVEEMVAAQLPARGRHRRRA